MTTSGGKLWTQRRVLHYSGLRPCVSYSIPLFLHNSDVNEVFFTDSDGRPLPCCRDYVYEALDHSLFWLGSRSSESGCAVAYVHLGMPGGCGGPRLYRSSEVLALADFFSGGKSGVLARWEACIGMEAFQANGRGGIVSGRDLICTEPFQHVEEGGIGVPPCDPGGEALWIEPGQEGLALRRKVLPLVGCGNCDRVHLRAHFYDDGEAGSGHWLWCGSSAGEAAVGLPVRTSGEEFYGYMQGPLSAASSLHCAPWQRSYVPRRSGWHVFELIWEEAMLHILIDNEPISMEPASGCQSEAEVCLYSSGKGYGVWAGVELFHTPAGQSTWGLGVQASSPGCFVPWELKSTEETGFWQDSGDFVIEHVSTSKICTLVPTWQQMLDAFAAVPGYTTHPVMQRMLGGVYEIITERPEDGMFGLLCPDGFMRFFPPAAAPMLHQDSSVPGPVANDSEAKDDVQSLQELLPVPIESLPVPPPAARADAIEDSALPATPRGLRLECWSVPNETDIEQLERILAHFVTLLQDEGVALPENIRLVGPCKELSHNRCCVYRFGTRRLHLATRSTDDGRLVLVVRCGGGFMDFLDFARRHGGLEQLRLRRQVGANSTSMVRVTSVLAEGRVHLRDASQKRDP